MDEKLKKKKWFDINRIKDKLILMTVVVISILTIVSISITLQNSNTQAVLKSINNLRIPIPVTTSEIMSGANRVSASQRAYIMTSDIKYKNERLEVWNDQINPAKEKLSDIKRHISNQEFIHRIDSITNQLTYYEKLQNEIDEFFETNLKELKTEESGTDSLSLIAFMESVKSKEELAAKLNMMVAGDASKTRKDLRKMIRPLNQAQVDLLIMDNQEVQNGIRQSNITLLASSIIGIFIIIVLALFLVKNLNSSIKRPVELLKGLSKGILPKENNYSKDELNLIFEATNILSTNMRKASDFALNVGEGNFDKKFSPASESDILGNSLVQMRDRLKNIALEDKKTEWATKGSSELSNVIRKDEDKYLLYNNILRFLINYLNANQGALFLSVGEGGTEQLEMQACYAYKRKKHLSKTIQLGEGLVGQVYQEKMSIYLKEIPENYISITSGLGDAPPNNIYIVPLKKDEEVVGVIEIAAFKELEEYQRTFIDNAAQIIGGAIASININETTKKLLEESQTKEEKLQSQEEELRQNLEELSATQESMERKTKELDQQNSKLSAILDSAIDPIITIDRDGSILSINKATTTLFGYPSEELIGSNVKMLMPDPPQSDHDGYLEEYNRTKQKHIIGNLRQVEARKKDGSLFPAEIAVNEAIVGNTSIFTGIIRDLSEKQRIKEDQEKYVEKLEITSQLAEKQFEEAKRLNHEMDARFHVLNESTILSESDTYGNIIYVNDKLCEVSQYQKEELIGKPHNIFRHDNMPKEVFSKMWKTISSGRTFRGYLKNRKKDGSPYYVDAVISPVLNDKKEPVKYISARYVINDIELAEQLIKQQNKNILAELSN